MYVSVRYYKSGGFYAGNEYTYETKLKLVPGDKVIAPTAKEPRQRGLVERVNLPKPAFFCREIAEYDPEAGEVTV